MKKNTGFILTFLLYKSIAVEVFLSINIKNDFNRVYNLITINNFLKKSIEHLIISWNILII